jgi:N-acylmannosamine kinase|tara:strand:- start:1057 stop:1947 length:891 start_codon:yes stop_codon:yes gene_type:complete
MNYKNLFVGVDIGGTKISIVFFKRNKIIKKIKLKTNSLYGPKNAEIIIENLLDYKKNIKRIGIATTGIIENGKWSVLNKKIIGNFKNFPLTEHIKKKINKPVFAFGDTEAAALGELKFGAGKKFSDFFYITISTGVGGSMVINKKPFTKIASLVGAFGHMVIKQKGKLCGCGRRGCIEAYASGNAIDKILKKSNKKNISTKNMLIKYKDTKWSMKIISEATTFIAEGIVNVNSLTGIRNFIIGGSIGLSHNFFREIIKNTKKITKQNILIIKAGLKNDSEVFGCLAKSMTNKITYD